MATPRSTEPGMNESVSLSREEVERLLRDADSTPRIEVANRISNAYNSAELDRREIVVAEQIFRLLLKDTELQVRQVMAESLKENPGIPRDIVLNMVKDVNEVSLPMINFSQVLSDADLIEIISSTSDTDRMIAVASRPTVSMRLSAALTDTGNEQVIGSLVRNEGAEISEATYQQIVKEFIDSEHVVSGLATRTILPLTVVEKLITVVSDSLADQLEKKYELSGARLDVDADKTREQTTIKLLDSAATPLEIERLVAQLHSFGRLTPSLIVTALCRGNTRFFELSLSKLAGIPHSNARALINDRGDLGFQALYVKAGLPDSMYMAIKLVMSMVRDNDEAGLRPGTAAYANRMVEKLLYHAEGKEIENLSYVLALIRQSAQPR